MNPFAYFARVMWAFIRREMAAVSGYRFAFVVRVLGVGMAVGSMVFLSRFVGAAVNPHLVGYGGNYLGFMLEQAVAAKAKGQRLGIYDPKTGRFVDLVV